MLRRLPHGNNDDRNNPFSCFKLNQNSSWFDFSQKNILDIKGNDIGLEREFLTQLFTKTIFPIYVLLLFPIFPFFTCYCIFCKRNNVSIWIIALLWFLLKKLTIITIVIWKKEKKKKKKRKNDFVVVLFYVLLLCFYLRL